MAEDKNKTVLGAPYLSLEVASILVLLLIQSGTAFWWASSINERMNGLESWRNETFTNGDRVSRIEERLDATKETLGRVEAKIDMLAQDDYDGAPKHKPAQ